MTGFLKDRIHSERVKLLGRWIIIDPKCKKDFITYVYVVII